MNEAVETLDHQLPPHQRCAAHSLNLVSTVNAEKAEAGQTYKRLARGAFVKFQVLWNKTSRSTQAAGAAEAVGS